MVISRADLPLGAPRVHERLNRVGLKDLDQMVGASLLVRITYLRPDDTVEHVAEFAGVVTSVDPLVQIERGGDRPFTLPPDADAFEVAVPGHYCLHSTGEIVVDPKYTTTWTVHPPQPE